MYHPNKVLTLQQLFLKQLTTISVNSVNNANT